MCARIVSFSLQNKRKCLQNELLSLVKYCCWILLEWKTTFSDVSNWCRHSVVIQVREHLYNRLVSDFLVLCICRVRQNYTPNFFKKWKRNFTDAHSIVTIKLAYGVLKLPIIIITMVSHTDFCMFKILRRKIHGKNLTQNWLQHSSLDFTAKEMWPLIHQWWVIVIFATN